MPMPNPTLRRPSRAQGEGPVAIPGWRCADPRLFSAAPPGRSSGEDLPDRPLRAGEPDVWAASVEARPAVLVLDTMGELAKFYGLADVAFVGGSLVPKGGHDILQPLFHGVPTLFGPHVHNQRALASVALEAGAARIVADAAALADGLTALVGDGPERSAMTAAAARLIAENRGASARCAAEVAGLVRGRISEVGCPGTRTAGGSAEVR